MRFTGRFLGYNGSAPMYFQISFVRGGRHDLGYERREGSRRQVPGLAAKTDERRAATYREENGWPHPERDFLVFRLVPHVRKGGDEESRSHNEEKTMCGE